MKPREVWAGGQCQPQDPRLWRWTPGEPTSPVFSPPCSPLIPLPALQIRPWLSASFHIFQGQLHSLFPSSSRHLLLGPLEGTSPPGPRQARPGGSHMGPGCTPPHWPARLPLSLSPPLLLLLRVSAKTRANWPPGVLPLRARPWELAHPHLTALCGHSGHGVENREGLGATASPPAAVRLPAASLPRFQAGGPAAPASPVPSAGAPPQGRG